VKQFDFESFQGAELFRRRYSEACRVHLGRKLSASQYEDDRKTKSPHRLQILLKVKNASKSRESEPPAAKWAKKIAVRRRPMITA
jgi:hypothetical protein